MRKNSWNKSFFPKTFLLNRKTIFYHFFARICTWQFDIVSVILKKKVTGKESLKNISFSQNAPITGQNFSVQNPKKGCLNDRQRVMAIVVGVGVF